MDTDDCGPSPGGQCGPVLEDEHGAPPHGDGHGLLPNTSFVKETESLPVSKLNR